MTQPSNPALHTSALTSLPLLARGKVRDNYAVGDDQSSWSPATASRPLT